jgi:hypothetical protein
LVITQICPTSSFLPSFQTVSEIANNLEALDLPGFLARLGE